MSDMRHRVCFTLQVDADRLDEYRQRHGEVWPEMLEALRDAGWHDYVLHLREDGLLVGHLVTDDFPATLAAMERTDVNARWQASMAPFFAGGRADQQMHVLDEVFDLTAQLRRAGLAADATIPDRPDDPDRLPEDTRNPR
jgi:L-rhamnose mutarotase